MQDQRLEKLTNWLIERGYSVQKIIPLTGDASFRRYFRVTTTENSFVAMDAPPPTENCRPFVCIAEALRQVGVCTPEIYESDLQQGFLLLSDWGDQVLHAILNEHNADEWYARCFEELLLIQKQTQLPSYPLKTYNNAFRSYYEEVSWFLTWYLQQHCHYQVTSKELAQLERELHAISEKMLEQPQVVIHRDYHSRNIMVLTDQRIGILDFQDAVIGPITYDLVSLLRDAYIDWPLQRVHAWVRHYHARLVEEHILSDYSLEQFIQWFDWTGLQRHLKCLGLFVRLNLRDHKPGYLHYIPRLIDYIHDVTQAYPELHGLNTLIKMKAHGGMKI